MTSAPVSELVPNPMLPAASADPTGATATTNADATAIAQPVTPRKIDISNVSLLLIPPRSAGQATPGVRRLPKPTRATSSGAEKPRVGVRIEGRLGEIGGYDLRDFAGVNSRNWELLDERRASRCKRAPVVSIYGSSVGEGGGLLPAGRLGPHLLPPLLRSTVTKVRNDPFIAITKAKLTASSLDSNVRF